MFGGYGGFPITFGGDESALEAEHHALLDAYAPGWDASADTANYAEAWAHAQVVSAIWAINERVRNQAQPMRMLEVLSEWETILNLRPTLKDLDIERRRRVASRLRGMASNTIADIAAVCRTMFGQNFDTIVATDPANQTTYWPGVNPGSPGWEWSSNRARIGVRVTKAGLDESSFLAKRAALAETLFAMLPAWLDFTIGVGSGFVVGQGVVGQTFV